MVHGGLTHDQNQAVRAGRGGGDRRAGEGGSNSLHCGYMCCFILSLQRMCMVYVAHYGPSDSRGSHQFGHKHRPGSPKLWASKLLSPQSRQPAVPAAAGLGCVSSQMSTYSSRSGLGTALKGICFTLLKRFFASSIKQARTCGQQPEGRAAQESCRGALCQGQCSGN